MPSGRNAVAAGLELLLLRPVVGRVLAAADGVSTAGASRLPIPGVGTGDAHIHADSASWWRWQKGVGGGRDEGRGGLKAKVELTDELSQQPRSLDWVGAVVER